LTAIQEEDEEHSAGFDFGLEMPSVQQDDHGASSEALTGITI
jgi:hypothetical protein